MDREFSGKVVLVTGATSGIGRATALRFAESGANVAAVGRKEDALAAVAEEITKRGGTPLAIRADLSVEDEARRVIAKTEASFGGIDVLINAAGHISSGTIESTSIEAWDAM